ncbi:MAG: sugar kinase [Ruminococcus sp.]|nr:sugar kinase [Ruminococcus sp.]
MAKRVVTFGEILLRLAPEGYRRFLQADSFGAVYGGGEANTALSLAQFGTDAAFVTKLPEHDIGQAAVNFLRSYGVDTSMIVRGGDRMGIYFLERGAAQRPSRVIYDRAGSAFALARREEFDWDRIFAGADWFHITGITPAVSDGMAEISLEAVKAAKRLGLTVSCDINYRAKLWDKAKAGRVLSGIMQYVDICIAGRGQAGDLFGIESHPASEDDYRAYEPVARELTERFGCRAAAVTLRTTVSSSDNLWAAMIYDGEKFCYSREYNIHIVDRVGGGDSFAAGLIYAQLTGMDTQQTVDFAAAAACLKLSVEGDANICSVQEVKELAESGSAQVQR